MFRCDRHEIESLQSYTLTSFPFESMQKGTQRGAFQHSSALTVPRHQRRRHDTQHSTHLQQHQKALSFPLHTLPPAEASIQLLPVALLLRRAPSVQQACRGYDRSQSLCWQTTRTASVCSPSSILTYGRCTRRQRLPSGLVSCAKVCMSTLRGPALQNLMLYTCSERLAGVPSA